MEKKKTYVPTGRPRGRPTEYLPEHCDAVIAAARDGLSLTGFAGTIGVTKRSVTKWCGVHEDFAESCEIAKAVLTELYERMALKIAQGEGGPGSAPLVLRMLANMSPDEHSETHTVRHAGANGEPLQIIISASQAEY